MLVEGLYRAILMEVLEAGEMQIAEVAAEESAAVKLTAERQASMRTALELCRQIVRERGAEMPELLSALEGEQDAGCFCDAAGAGMLKNLANRQALLECARVDDRLELLLKLLAEELEVEALEGKIQQRVREYMDRANHEYYLREQIHAIQDELGDNEDEEIAELRAKLAKSKMNDEARERVSKELERLARTAVQAPESAGQPELHRVHARAAVGREGSARTSTSARARRVLRGRPLRHEGGQGAPDRVPRRARGDEGTLKSPILCLVGPPGVGKTSIARSVAQALGRKFTQMSLGGVHDEAEIRGHRQHLCGRDAGAESSPRSRQCGVDGPRVLVRRDRQDGAATCAAIRPRPC